MKGKQIYWEDVETGQEIPGYSLKLTWTQMVRQVDGSQDYNPVHHDPDFAKADGRAGVFMNTGFSQGSCSRVMTDWIGDRGFLTFFRMEMRKENWLLGTMVFKGKVTNKYVKDSQHYVDAEVMCENENGEVTIACKTTATLPARG